MSLVEYRQDKAFDVTVKELRAQYRICQQADMDG